VPPLKCEVRGAATARALLSQQRSDTLAHVGQNPSVRLTPGLTSDSAVTKNSVPPYLVWYVR
jgi:hypothetical protein